jgi:hypothetical protein
MKMSFKKLIEDGNRIGNHKLKDVPETLTWTRDTTTTVPDHYPCYVDFPSKYPCEVTSPWDRFDSFLPQDFPMTMD